MQIALKAILYIALMVNVLATLLWLLCMLDVFKSHIWAYAYTYGIRKLPKLEFSYTYIHTPKLSHTMTNVSTVTQ